MKAKAKKTDGKAGTSKRKPKKAQAVPVTLRGLLLEVIEGERLIADRLESVRRTLWRMSAVREYHGKSGAADGADATEAGTAETKGGEV